MNLSVRYRTAFLLSLILIMAFVFRVWGVNFGLPGLFHFDERLLVYDSLYLLSHKGHITTYRGLIPYLLAGLYSIYYIFLRITGKVQTPFDFLVLYAQDQSNVYLMGRIVFVLSATLSVFVIYLLGKKLYNKSIGLMSAFFLSFNFLSIQEAKVMKYGPLGTLFLLLSFYFCLSNGSKEMRIKNYILSGIFMGLAIGTYATLIIAPFALMFVCLANKGIKFNKRFKNFFVLVVASIITFLIVTPPIFIEFSKFITGIRSTSNALNAPWINPGHYPIWLFYLVEHLRKGMGCPLEIVAILGLMYSLYKTEDIGIIIFLVLFFGISLNSSLGFARYVIPAIPFFAFFASKFIYQIIYRGVLQYVPTHSAHSIKTKQILIVLASIGLVFPNLINAIKYNYLLSCPDTRNIARKFIEETIPTGTKIVAEGLETQEQTSCLGVPLHKSKKQLSELLEMAKEQEQGIAGRYLLALIKGQKEPTYRVENIYLLEYSPYEESKYASTIKIWESLGITYFVLPDVDIYIKKGVDYLITTNWVRNHGWEGEDEMPKQFLHSLEKEYQLIKEFNPCPVFKWDYYCWAMDYEALSKVALFNSNVRGGPLIRIYKRK